MRTTEVYKLETNTHMNLSQFAFYVFDQRELFSALLITNGGHCQLVLP